MTDQEKYLLAIQLAEVVAKLCDTQYGPVADRFAELAMELLDKKPE